MNIRSYKDKKPSLGKGVYVDPSAVILGDVTIEEDSSVWPLVAIRGDMTAIKIGKRTTVQDGSILHSTHPSDFNPGGYPLSIGDDVSVGHQAMLHGCTIGDRVVVGMACIVMDGAIVENDVVIGAGSLVPPGKTLESGYLYVGRPAKQVRPLTDKEMAFFTYVAGNYVKVKNDYLADMADEA